jgi:mono/diheme cytochrome c family protein
MKRVIFWIITFGAILGACLTNNANALPKEYAIIVPPENLNAPELIAAGRDLYLADCAVCHGVSGNGQGTTQPRFGLKVVDFTDRAKMQSLAPQYLFWRVSEGGRVEPFRAQGSIMPAWKFQLSDAQRWQLVAYVRTLAR